MFKERGQWLDGSAEPSPGMIIFYDRAKNGLDGQADHTGYRFFFKLRVKSIIRYKKSKVINGVKCKCQ